MKKKNVGFTLVELLAVLVILALLILLAGSSVVRLISGLDKDDSELNASKIKTIENAAEKWSLDNIDKFDDEDAQLIQVGLDIVFVIDVSGGMQTGTMPGDKNTTKSWAAVYAANSILNIFNKSNLNRAAFVFFGGSVDRDNKEYARDYHTIDQTPLKNIQDVSLGYTPEAKYAKNGASNILYKENGVTKKTVTFTSKGTYTMGGIQIAANILLNADDKKDRIPVIVVLTDGEPSVGVGTRLMGRYEFGPTMGDWGAGGTTWCLGGTTWDKFKDFGYGNSYAKYCKADTSVTDSIPKNLKADTVQNRKTINQNSARMYWNVINVASGAKEKISEAYNGSDMYFYTVGIGLSSHLGKFIVDPSSTNLANLPSEDIINKQVAGSYEYYDQLWHTEIAQQLYQDMTSDSSRKNYYYPTAAFTDENMSTERLEEIFSNDIAQKLIEATKVSTVCVTLQTLLEQGYLTENVTKKFDNIENEYVLVQSNDATHQFSYTYVTTDKQRETCNEYFKPKN